MHNSSYTNVVRCDDEVDLRILLQDYGQVQLYRLHQRQ